jgi:molybdate/tungstate transport system substrate-binding protein
MTTQTPFVAAALAAALVGGCGAKPEEKVVVLCADSLGRPFAEVKKTFERDNPGLRVTVEPYGSVVTARRIQEGVPCDVVALADTMLFDEMLYPGGHASWFIAFCTNEIVVIQSTRSKYNTEINKDNWFEILTRPDVKVAAADPTLDPCGYWSRITWRLADLHYGRTEPGKRISDRMEAACAGANTQPDTASLISRVEAAGGWDYAFVYKAQAEQARIAYLSLPAEINLGHAGHAEFYNRVEYEIPKSKTKMVRRGRPLIFGLSIASGARNAAGAEKFTAFLLSETGRDLCRKQGLPMLDKPWSPTPEKLPAGLRGLVVQGP